MNSDSKQTPTYPGIMNGKFRDVLGKPSQGVHAYKLFGIAVVDVLLTLGLAFGISKGFGTPFWSTLLSVFLIGEGLHLLLGVETTIVKKLKEFWSLVTC